MDHSLSTFYGIYWWYLSPSVARQWLKQPQTTKGLHCLSRFISCECLFDLPGFTLPPYFPHTSFSLFHLLWTFLQSTSNASKLLSSELSSSEFSVESESEDPLTQLAKEVKQQLFTTNGSLQESLERHRWASARLNSRPVPYLYICLCGAIF